MFQDIPPLRALKSFEAAARHLSFTRAAEEMHLTQAAVSHQIKSLEERLGAKLFRRQHRRLRLTEAGQNYLPEVREGLNKLLVATERIKSLRPSGVLTLSVLPSFATKWLVPRLHQFRQRCPDIDLRISAFEWPVDFRKDDVDAAIRYGRGQWSGLAAVRLMGEAIFPVCSPALAADPERPLRRPADLRHHTLLHDEFSREDWSTWLSRAGVKQLATRRGITFSHTSMMLDAAENGHGVALGRTPLVSDDLKRGRLVAPFTERIEGELAYYLVYPVEAADFARIAAFREWISEEAASSTAADPQPEVEPGSVQSR